MRMTRAQAAALAAAGDELVDQHNDQLDDINRDDKIESTTGESGEREALAELTHPLDTNNDEENNAVPGEQVDEPEEQEENQEAEKKSESKETNSDKVEDQDASAAQKEPGSPTTELPLLNITPQRTPAKNMIKNEFAHMRSTSNKENMVPGSPLVAAPLASSQVNLASGQPEVQTPQQTQPQSADEQKKDAELEGGEASEPTQAEDGQDDSLVGHFEALSVSPKKQKSSELQVVPGAEQLAPGSLEEQNDKEKTDATKSAPATSQDKEKKASASPVAKKPSSASSQTDTPKLARKPSVRQSTLGRQSSVIRKSMAPPSRPEPSTTTAIKRTTSIKRSSVRPSIAPRPGSSQSTKRIAPLAKIPHSKPRPMSMSFPTPPPPPRSTKAATQATFQLPGEAIAAKLKADKEARLLRQAESGGVVKSTYKPPTTQKSTKAPTKATFQLPGEAIAAKLKQEKEDRLKRQEESGGGGATASKPTYIPPVVQKSTKPVTKATFQLSSDAFAAKMKAQKEARLAKQKEEEEKRERERGVFKARPAPKISKPAEVRQTTASRARLPSTETSGLGRASSVREPLNTTAAKKRLSSFHPSASTTTTMPPRATTSFQKRQSLAPSASKGKEVFSRAKEGKEKEEKDKKEKEEAAKKARSEAAEAGRLKSREWAEKKKEKERRKTAAAALV
ncbi:hypothetical protein E4T44_04280 [Aureobasidium sp. EXF-8845]|nr:hypothetical protein E4T44_04280 [Aureobasidium sp. EXF-8845]